MHFVLSFPSEHEEDFRRNWVSVKVSMHFVLSFPSERYAAKPRWWGTKFQCTSCFHSPPNDDRLLRQCGQYVSMHFVLSFPSELFKPATSQLGPLGFNALRAFIPLRTCSRGDTRRHYLFQCTSCFHSPPNQCYIVRIRCYLPVSMHFVLSFPSEQRNQRPKGRGGRVSMHFVLSFPSERGPLRTADGDSWVFQCTSCFHSPPNWRAVVADRRQSFQCTSCFHSPPNFIRRFLSFISNSMFQCTSCFHSPPNLYQVTTG